MHHLVLSSRALTYALALFHFLSPAPVYPLVSSHSVCHCALPQCIPSSPPTVYPPCLLPPCITYSLPVYVLWNSGRSKMRVAVVNTSVGVGGSLWLLVDVLVSVRLVVRGWMRLVLPKAMLGVRGSKGPLESRVK